MPNVDGNMLVNLKDLKIVHDEAVDLKSAINSYGDVEIVSMTYGYYIPTNSGTVNVNTPSPSSSGLGYAVVECTEGDVFTVTGEGYGNGRLYAFVDQSGNRLEPYATADASATNLRVVAPANSAYAVFNSKPPCAIYKGEQADAKIEEACDEVIDSIDTKLDRITEPDLVSKESDYLTEYSSNGYVDPTTGEFKPNDSYSTYYFQASKNCTLWVTGYVPNYLTVSVTTQPFASLIDFRSAARDDLPTEESKLSVQRGLYVQICVKTTSDFNIRCTDLCIPYGLEETENSLHLINTTLGQITELELLDKSSRFLTKYGENGYVDPSTGVFKPNDGYYTYYFQTTEDCDIWVEGYVPNYLAVAVTSELFSSNIDFRSAARENLPTSANKMTVQKGLIVEICVKTTADFNIRCTQFKEPYGYKEVQEDIASLEARVGDSSMILIPDTASHFSIKVVCTAEHYYTYDFTKITATKTIDGQTITTMDCWEAMIRNERGYKMLQGNLNFVHMLATPAGHGNYVGAGDGLCVTEWGQFFVDGKQFVPGTDTETIKCSEFRFLTKLRHYLSDGTGTDTPSIDGSGNPITESFNVMNIQFTKDGIKGRNRLILDIDGVTFEECYGAMLGSFYDDVNDPLNEVAFDNVVIMNGEATWNKVVDNSGTISVITAGDSLINLHSHSRHIGNSATLYGPHIVVSCTMTNMGAGDNSKFNFRCAIIPATPPDHRMKVYFVPVITTKSKNYDSEHPNADQFNAGDIIDVQYEKTIRYYSN